MPIPDNARLYEHIKLLWECRHTCQETLFNHCLNEGGQHVEPTHVKTMMDCIQICQTAADFMTRYSEQHQSVCAACADICEACAASCEHIEDKKMQACADVCRRCAKVCREMANPVGEAAA